MVPRITRTLLLILILGSVTCAESKLICANPDPEVDAVIGRWDFQSPSDTSLWAFENIPQTTGQPAVSWLSNYDGVPGVMKLEFTRENQGVKITLMKPEWLSSSSTQWYRLKVRVKTDDGSSDTVSFIAYLYNGLPPGPTDITGKNIDRVPTSWATQELYINSVGGITCMYCQLVIRNENKIPAAVYIDSAEIAEARMPEMVDINYKGADFSSSKNVNDFWQYQNGIGTDWPESYDISSGKLNVSFSGTTAQSLKMTMGDHPGVTLTHPVHPGKLVGQQVHFVFQGDTKDSIVMVASYGIDKPGSVEFKELGITARMNRIVNGDNEILQTIYLGTQPYDYGQVIVRNGAASHFYLEGMYPLEEK